MFSEETNPLCALAPGEAHQYYSGWLAFDCCDTEEDGVRARSVRALAQEAYAQGRVHLFQQRLEPRSRGFRYLAIGRSLRSCA